MENALEQGSKQLDAVGVHRAAPVLALAVVDASMTVFGQAPVGCGLVSAGPGTEFQVCPYEGLQGSLPVVGHHHTDHIGGPVLQADPRRLADGAASGAQFLV